MINREINLKRRGGTILIAAAAAFSLAGCGTRSDGNVDQPAITNIADADPSAIEAIPADEASAGGLPANTGDAVATEPADAQYVGRWKGVEGMYLIVNPKPDGGMRMEMQWDLDHKGSFDGSVTAEGLRFVRNGVAEMAVPSDGAATGLKYLAGKQDCLTVKSGEGYCRD